VGRTGLLIDATAAAAEAEVKYPVALTRTAWEAAVIVLPDLAGRSEAARLWDVDGTDARNAACLRAAKGGMS
jgi:hypothetical protein